MTQGNSYRMNELPRVSARNLFRARKNGRLIASTNDVDCGLGSMFGILGPTSRSLWRVFANWDIGLRLDGFYREYFERLKDEVENVSVLDLLGPMYVVREPLLMSLISALLKTSENETKRIINKAQVLLVRVGYEVRFLHKSMSD